MLQVIGVQRSKFLLTALPFVARSPKAPAVAGCATKTHGALRLCRRPAELAALLAARSITAKAASQAQGQPARHTITVATTRNKTPTATPKCCWPRTRAPLRSAENGPAGQCRPPAGAAGVRRTAGYWSDWPPAGQIRGNASP